MALSRNDKKASDGGLGETIKVIVQALILALIVRTFLFQPFNIPSGSMKPTLLVGDYLFVSKFSYGYSRYSFPFSPALFAGRVWESKPERGDIAVFKLPRDGSTDYIKRVVGLPGETVQVIDGLLHINGDPVNRERIESFADSDRWNRTVEVDTYMETLPNGVSYVTLDLHRNSTSDNTPVYRIPEGHYFMMGDNRDNSTDSRFLREVGFVPYENFVGRAEIIFFSIKDGVPAWQFWQWPWTVRWERLLDSL